MPYGNIPKLGVSVKLDWDILIYYVLKDPKEWYSVALYNCMQVPFLWTVGNTKVGLNVYTHNEFII